jgi:RNA polymerase sigma factor (TIGR02999 family)
MPTTDNDTHDITQLLQAWGAGEAAALAQLIPLVYGELRQLAQQHMRREHAGHTLQTTALIHEAYLRLMEAGQVRLENRRHFFAAASRLMRQVLVDLARERGSRKRGGAAQQISFEEALLVSPHRDEELLALDEALNALAAFDARKSQIVELRFFGGLDVEETAAVLQVSVITIHRDWRFAKSWLSRYLRGGSPDET